MIDAVALLAECQVLVRSLVDDLRMLTGGDPETAKVVDAEYARASTAGRTALTKAEWAEGLYAQVAVAWVLGCVFVRFCEDNGLVPDPLLAGPGGRRAIALDHRTAYVHANPAHDDRHWLREIFRRYCALPATGEIFGEHNPVWLLAPSADGARGLVQSFQAVDPDSGEVRHDFTDPSWDTRFLGDLYQDLSEHAKKTYALLQTPVFVEEFILDRTLEPALATFGLRETTLIDPTCGSGHFLLGAFARLFQRWRNEEPGTNPRELARRALDAIAGVDLNPFAVAIARFRLLVAAMRASGDSHLADSPAYPIHVAVGDSLLHGDPPGRLAGTSGDEEMAGAAAHGYATEDLEEARTLLSRSWHVVVGNPPYITVKDPALNDLYRRRFATCHRQYSLGVPFTERFVEVARAELGDWGLAGFIGMITANSFMKREFGKKLIENYFPTVDLTHVLDTSGVPIPGHGTGSVILFLRNRTPKSLTVRALLKKADDSSKADPGKSPSWQALLAQLDCPGSETAYFSAIDVKRESLSRHPWSLGGGGAAELKEILEAVGRVLADSIVPPIGRAVRVGHEDVFLFDRPRVHHAGETQRLLRPFLIGEDVRDWAARASMHVWYPYGGAGVRDEETRPLWPWRVLLANRATFGGTIISSGLNWYQFQQHTPSAYSTPLSIAFPNIATHNHFALDRGGVVFNASAPVVKLRTSLGEKDHLALLAVLNSSTVCFWLKQVMYPKGGDGVGRGIQDEPWETRYAYDGTKLARCPVPVDLPVSYGEALDRLSDTRKADLAQLTEHASAVSRRELEISQWDAAEAFARMVATQEELDWAVYRAYGLTTEDLTAAEGDVPGLELGARAFEIVLARRLTAGEEQTSWFARHGSTPITELPTHWPESYKRLVKRRIELIETDLNIGLIERPEYKRRWAAKPWEEQVKAALREWLLDRLESSRYWPEPTALTSIARLAAEARTDGDIVQTAQLYTGREDVDIAALVTELVKAEAVPYLAAWRYTDSGMRKHAQWLETWELQRREDAGEDVGTIPVPPKYVKADFQGVAWDHRGKLDVPKERFTSYPGAERETDPSLVVGWAGWDHLAWARALATWYLQARRDGRDREHLRPLLAGLAELAPWLKQWYDDPNPDPALDRPGSQIAALVDAEMRVLHLTADDLAGWRPAPTRRGRARR